MRCSHFDFLRESEVDRSGAGASDKLCGNHDVFAWRGSVCFGGSEVAQGELDGRVSQLMRVLGQGGEVDVGQGRLLGVVEADHRQVPGNASAEDPGLADHPDGAAAVEGEHGRLRGDHALDAERLDRTLEEFMATYFPVAAPWER